MTMALEFKPVTLAREGDAAGQLVFQDGRLLAIVAQLDAAHDGLAGHWCVEVRIDELMGMTNHTFEDLQHVEAWFASILGRQKP